MIMNAIFIQTMNSKIYEESWLWPSFGFANHLVPKVDNPLLNYL